MTRETRNDELAARARILARPANLDYLLTRRTAFLRRFLTPGARVLEVGAGYGIVGLYVPGVRATSTDVRHTSWIDVVADAMVLPFSDRVFDAVVCLNMLHHLPYPRRGLEEMVRVLRSDGRLLIAEPHVSLALRAALSLTRHETIDWTVDPFGVASCKNGSDAAEFGNNAISDLLFENLARFQREFPELELEHHALVECLTFLNSGGVGFRAPYVPLPRAALALCGRVDDWLSGFPRVFPLCRELVFRKKGA